jgi:hypothetical protein
MTKFEFNRDHARKLAEKLYPGDIYETDCGKEECEHCNYTRVEWQETIERVFKALKSLEGEL